MSIGYRFSIVLLAIGLAAVTNAYAASPKAAMSGLGYFGGKAGFMMPDASGFDDAVNVGVYGGYNLLGKGALNPADLGGGTLAIEGELTLSLLDGDFTVTIPPLGTVSGDWDLTTLGVYAAYRYPLSDTFFVKGKAGLVRGKLDVSAAGVPGRGTDTDISLGGGLGWKVGQGILEVELTLIETHSDFKFLSVGYFWSF